MGRNFAGAQKNIGNGQTLNVEAANQWIALVNDICHRLGIEWVVPTEGTRTWERQNYLYVNQHKPGFNPAYSPDRPSDHQWGNAVDGGTGMGYRGNPVQVLAHQLGPAYGFDFPIGNELWHARYRRELRRIVAEADVEYTYGAGPWSAVKASRDGAAEAAARAAEAEARARAEEEARAREAARLEALRIEHLKKTGDNMLWIRSTKSGAWYLIGELTVQKITAHAEARKVSAARGLNAVKLKSSTCRWFIDQAAARAAVVNEGVARAIGELLSGETTEPDPTDIDEDPAAAAPEAA